MNLNRSEIERIFQSTHLNEAQALIFEKLLDRAYPVRPSIGARFACEENTLHAALVAYVAKKGTCAIQNTTNLIVAKVKAIRTWASVNKVESVQGNDIASLSGAKKFAETFCK